jgi:hypothetical protein
MTDLLMLAGASIGSMAFGILSAYGILRIGFSLIRPPQREVKVKTQPEIAQIS